MPRRASHQATLLFLLTACCLWLSGCGPGVDAESLPAQPALFIEDMSSAAKAQIRELRARVDQKPLSAPRNGKLGMALQSYGLDVLAAAYYERAHLIDPSEFRWAFYLGMTRERTGNPSGALEAYLAANAEAPEQLTVRRRLAETLMALDRLDDSEKILAQSLAASPGDVQTMLSYGRLRLRQQRYAEAREIYARALAAGDPSGQAYQGLATAARGLGDEQEAERNLRLYETNKNEYGFVEPLITAIGSMNRSHFYHEQRARQFLARQQPEAAIREYRAALEKEPENISVRSALLPLLAANGKIDEARALFEQGKSIAPDSAKLYLSFGLALVRAGKAKEAVDAIETSIKIEPEYTAARLQLGLLLERQQQAKRAERHYRAILRYEPDNGDAHYMLGRRHLARRDFEAARLSFLRASAIKNEKTPMYLRALAGTLADLSEYGQAEAALQRALTMLKDYPNETLQRQLTNDLKRLDTRARQGASK